MPLSPTATRDLLAKLGHSPKRFLGQNFLVDGNIVRKSLELAEVRAGDVVVEIGPGLGTLTSALLEAGAEIWAVEKDRVMHAHLAETLGTKFPKTFHLLEGDAVEWPLAGLAGRAVDAGEEPGGDAGRRRNEGNGSRGEGTPPTTEGAAERPGAHSTGSGQATALPTAEFKIVANLPYAIATPWLDEVLSGPLPARMVLMLQQEAAQRYVAQPGSKAFGAISIFLQAAYDVAPGHKVAAACFYPRPDVESHLLHLVRKPQPFVFPKTARALIRACFQQRRKQIGALLRARLPGAAAHWRELLVAHGLSEQARPEAIPVGWWVRFSALVPP